MVASRQDAWTEDDDLVLAEVTLRHIREGSTQLAAFEEVGQRLGRTAAACGFRWNSTVRKQYEAAIAIAKSQRQQMKKLGKVAQTEFADDAAFVAEAEETKAPAAVYEEEEPVEVPVAKASQAKASIPAPAPVSASSTAFVETDELQIDSVIRFLTGQKEILRRFKQLERDYEAQSKELRALREENEQIKKDLQKTQDVSEDYKALVQIVDRARKMAFLKEEENDKAIFKMDPNGNLERIE
ncbi:RsfA family transcriptional regulator [Brevibacillus dissolubilis]|uniref:RsfA family transcriptional regulator n=1 Tax=Brevibacillus dissolubilis TaxID=1844116 RepID=UPI0011160814|nr:RsfA family transcriptional regulator [Brevibacillus dissolubilis]